MTVITFLLVLGFLYLSVSTPFIVAVLFIVTLLMAGMVVGSVDGFLGFIVFVVYVGGALVLFSYCFMLTPLQATRTPLPVSCLPLFFVRVRMPLWGHRCLYEFYWVSSLLVRVGVLLFVVMVCVVSLIDFSLGTMRVV